MAPYDSCKRFCQELKRRKEDSLNEYLFKLNEMTKKRVFLCVYLGKRLTSTFLGITNLCSFKILNYFELLKKLLFTITKQVLPVP